MSPRPNTAYGIPSKVSFGVLLNFIDLQKFSAFSGASPLPVVLQQMRIADAFSCKGTFLTVFNVAQYVGIPNP